MKRIFLALSSVASIVSAQCFAESVTFDPIYNMTMDDKGRIVKHVTDNEVPTLVNRIIGTNNKTIKYNVEQAPQEIQRYIVELKGAPIFKQQALLLKQKGYTSIQSIEQAQANAVIKQMTSYQSVIEQEQNKVSRQLSTIATKLKVIKRYQKVNNALVIEANSQDIDKIKQLANVKQVTPERRFHVTLAESVPLINAPSVWALKDDANVDVKGAGVTVAILDTGIDYTHPSLGGCLGADCRVAAGYDFVNNDNDPMDGHGHGTHVAGIVGASSDDMTGVAPEVTLYAYKVLSDGGWGTNTDIIAAIEKAVDPDGDPLTDDAVDVINMSLGGGGEPTGPLSTAVNNAVEAGVIVVVAAGNGGEYGDINTSSPANAEKAITVASSTKDDQLSYFSSKGLPDGNYSLKPEITAPGSDIVSTYLDGGTTSLSGTSMASPHVAGAVALLKQLNPELNTQQAKELLMAGAVDLNLDPLAQGAGRMDIEQSVLADSVLENGLVNLGQVDKNASSWSSTKSLTIKNLSNVEQTYSISLPESFVAGAVLSVDKEDVTIPALSSASVEVTVNIEDVANFSYPESNAGIFFDDIKISTEIQELTAKIVLDHALILAIQNKSSVYSSVLIQSDDYSFFSWPYIAPDEVKEVRVPNTTLRILADYSWLTADQVQNKVPEGSTVFGFETYSVDTNETSELTLNFGDLTSVIGMQSVQGDDESFPMSSFHSEIMGTRIIHGSINSGSILFGGQKAYVAFGHLANNTQITFDQQYVIENIDTEADKHIYQLWHKASDQNIADVSFNLDVVNDPQFSVNFENIVDDSEVLEFGLFKSGAGSIFNESPKKIIVHSYTDESPDFTYTKLALFAPSEEQGWSNLIVSSNGVTLNPEEGVNKVGQYNQFFSTYPNREVNAGAQGVYWSARPDFNSEKVNIRDSAYSAFTPNLLSDTLDNLYSSGLDFQYQWYCDAIALTGNFIDIGLNESMTFNVPDESCSELQIEFGFDSYLAGEKYRSTALMQVVGYDYVPALQAIHLYEGDNIVQDQTFNKLSPRIDIKFDYQQAEVVTGEIRLDSGEWQDIDFSFNDHEGQSAAIAMITGNHVVDLRLTYQSGQGNAVVQTLNGFFKLGTESGSDNDLDDDGIPNGEDTDLDNDGVLNVDDLFPLDPTEAYDSDEDGIGNNADTDDDNDGVPDEQDAFPLDPTESIDTDEDGIGNNADTDDDNDGVLDEQDAFPLDPTETLDTDNDGTGNNADIDDDNDNVIDDQDAFPLDPTESVDTDNDGIGNNADTDDDNDSVSDDQDAFPLDANESVDTDGDGIGNNADTDDDNDGVSDASDAYPLDATRSQLPTPPAKNNNESSGGGGSFGFGLLLMLMAIARRRYSSLSKE